MQLNILEVLSLMYKKFNNEGLIKSVGDGLVWVRCGFWVVFYTPRPIPNPNWPRSEKEIAEDIEKIEGQREILVRMFPRF